MIATTPFVFVPMNNLDAPVEGPAIAWIWEGYLARGTLTVLTSLWKTGKTTLISGLLQRMASADRFLDHLCGPARVLVVSEEPRALWQERMRTMPIGPHVHLLARPFQHRPTADDWERLIDHVAGLRTAGEVDLLVIDTLASFLPDYCENDGSAVMQALAPLQRLASTGMAVLMLHHPRRARSAEGSSARGAGALLAAVDFILELHHFGSLEADNCRRKLVARSRCLQTTPRIVYRWNAHDGSFTVDNDPLVQQFQENWAIVQGILENRESACTHHELLADWPPERVRPSASVLYNWLNRALDEGTVRRHGKGCRGDPYLFRLTNEDDVYYDRGELPPLPELEPIIGPRGLPKKKRKQ